METLENLPKAFDVVVVGARSAGAATALLLARAGFSVLAIDRAGYGSDTLSTHALMRAGVTQLSRWGVLDRVIKSGAVAIRTVHFHYGEDVVDIQIKGLHGVDALYAPLRVDLDPILVDAARAAGADIRHHVKLVQLIRTAAGAVTGAVITDRSGRRARVEAAMVIGADGRRSDVARLVGAATYRSGRHASPVIYGHFVDVPTNGYHWHFRPGLAAGLIPASRGQTCVFVSALDENRMRARDLGKDFFDILADAAPEVSARLSGLSPVKGFRTFPGYSSFLRQSAGEGWALVGDAGYFKDPCTAHGMTDALVDAELLVRAVSEGTRESLDRYQSTRDALSIGLLEVTDAIASFEWDFPLLRSYHRVLSEEMGRKMAEVVAFDDSAFRAA